VGKLGVNGGRQPGSATKRPPAANVILSGWAPANGRRNFAKPVLSPSGEEPKGNLVGKRRVNSDRGAASRQ